MFDNTIEELGLGVYNTTMYLYNDGTEEEVTVSVIVDYDKSHDPATGEVTDVDIYNVTFDEPFSFNGITYDEGATLEDCSELKPYMNKVDWTEEMRIEILDWAANLE